GDHRARQGDRGQPARGGTGCEEGRPAYGGGPGGVSGPGPRYGPRPVRPPARPSVWPLYGHRYGPCTALGTTFSIALDHEVTVTSPSVVRGPAEQSAVRSPVRGESVETWPARNPW